MTDSGQAAACPIDSSPVSNGGTPLLHLGQVLATPGALELLRSLQLTPLRFVLRHMGGDWGDICEEDRQSNAEALVHGARVLSVYELGPTQRLWIITEADRSCTTLLLPEEY
ncbi:type I restriction endonuclease subunit M [Comamonas terrigena]|uniref:type I restriction endonuclease subunit M n=1 Tax=Comamonas terrigena TaxID=32013 RepID=UPI00289C1C72|nr:type I restriction endonuclease subunit M [Comamonas terrigena]